MNCKPGHPKHVELVSCFVYHYISSASLGLVLQWSTLTPVLRATFLLFQMGPLELATYLSQYPRMLLSYNELPGWEKNLNFSPRLVKMCFGKTKRGVFKDQLRRYSNPSRPGTLLNWHCKKKRERKSLVYLSKGFCWTVDTLVPLWKAKLNFNTEMMVIE